MSNEWKNAIVLLSMFTGAANAGNSIRSSRHLEGIAESQPNNACLLGRSFSNVTAALGWCCDIDSAGPNQFEVTYLDLGIRLTFGNERVTKVEPISVLRPVQNDCPGAVEDRLARPVLLTLGRAR
jgi:hypothetical protein